YLLAGDRQHVRPDPGPDLGLGPRVDLAQHAAEDHHAGVEQVDQVGDADAEPVADAVEGVAGRGVALVGGAHHLLPALAAGQLAGPPGEVDQRLLADLRLQAAAGAAGARPPLVRVHHHVAELAAVPALAVEQPAGDADPAVVA